MSAIGGPPSAYELQAVPSVGLDSLDLEAAAAFADIRAPSLATLPLQERLQRIGLATRYRQEVVPTTLGLYVFGTLPQLTYPQWTLVAACIEGNKLPGTVRSRQDLEGGLPTMVAAGLAFVREHSLAGRAEGVGEYPEVAVREALVNALVHRDLRSAGQVSLRLLGDHLEIRSPGGPALPAALPLEDLLAEGGLSLPRNAFLARTARVLGLSEQLGRGLPALREAVSRGGAQRPVRVRGTQAEVVVVIPSGYAPA